MASPKRASGAAGSPMAGTLEQCRAAGTQEARAGGARLCPGKSSVRRARLGPVTPSDAGVVGDERRVGAEQTGRQSGPLRPAGPRRERGAVIARRVRLGQGPDDGRDRSARGAKPSAAVSGTRRSTGTLPATPGGRRGQDAPPRPGPIAERGSPSCARRSPAGRRCRSRRPGRRGSRAPPASPARRGSPSVRRRRRRPGSGSSSGRQNVEAGDAAGCRAGGRLEAPDGRPDPPVAGRSPAWAASIVADAVVAPIHRQSALLPASGGPPCARPASLAARASRRRAHQDPAVAKPPSRERALPATARATSTFWGNGRPWLMSVDSRATTGRPAARASAASGATSRRARRAFRRGSSGMTAA
jgi:hypothetical protein